jgi:hypothetical protein
MDSMRTQLPATALLVMLLATLGLARPFVAGPEAQTVAEVIEKHLAALGGRAALGKITSRLTVGTVALSSPTGDLNGTIEALYKVPNKMRAQVALDLTPMGMTEKMQIDQRFDGKAGWILNSLQGDAEMTGDQLENMRNSMFPSPLLNFQERGVKVELQPKETLAGKEAVVLLVIPKSGPAARVYLDPDTYLAMRSTIKMNSPEMGELNQVSEPSDYRTVDGIKVPFKIVNSSEMQTVTIVLSKVTHNVPADDAQFSRK